MNNPQTAFMDMLIAALEDAASSGSLTQLSIQLDPTEGKGPLKRVRVIVVPEEMQVRWPSHAPLGTPGG